MRLYLELALLAVIAGLVWYIIELRERIRWLRITADEKQWILRHRLEQLVPIARRRH